MKGGHSVDHLIEDTAERPHIISAVEVEGVTACGGEGFGGHVIEGAHSLVAEGFGFATIHFFGDSEIDEFETAWEGGRKIKMRQKK